MNINIYLEDALGNYLNQYAKQIGKSRNALIREAIKDWVAQHGIKQWPASILNFSGLEEFPSFESSRNELLPPNEDPLA